MHTLKRVFVVSAAAVMALAAATPPAVAQAAQAAAQPAVRAGDSTLSCEAIITEINSLAATHAKTAERAEQRARASRGLMNFAKGALSAAGPMLAQGALGNSSGGMGSAMTQMAMQQAQTQAMTQAMMAGQSQASGYGQQAQPTAPAAAPQSPRLQHLNGLFMQRGC